MIWLNVIVSKSTGTPVSLGPLFEAFLCVSFREAMGVVLHKDSKWYQQWKDFKDNNMVVNRKD